MDQPTPPITLTDDEWCTVRLALTVLRDRAWLTTEQRDEAGELVARIDAHYDRLPVPEAVRPGAE